VPIVHVKKMHEAAFLIVVIARQSQRLTAILCLAGFAAAADMVRNLCRNLAEQRNLVIVPVPERRLLVLICC
jgi:hypothetical protein